MKIGRIIEVQQPEIYKRLNNKNKRSMHRRGAESLSFNDVKNMMKHHRYYRGKGGAIRQKG